MKNSVQKNISVKNDLKNTWNFVVNIYHLIIELLLNT